MVKLSYRYFGDITWFSQRKTPASYGSVGRALSMHILYIANEKREDLLYTEGLDQKKWKEIVQSETSRRWDSRVAGKVTFALPNELGIEEAKAFIREFIENEIGAQDYGFALHRPKGVVSGKDNFHAHVVFSARGRDGKKLRINRRKLSELQKKWDQYLERYTGLKPFKVTPRIAKKIRPYHVRPESGLYDERAVEYLRVRREFIALYFEALKEELESSQVSLQAAPPRRPLVRAEGPYSPLSVNLESLESSVPDEEDEFSLQLRTLDNEIMRISRKLSRKEEELENTNWLNVLKRKDLKKEIRRLKEELKKYEKEYEQLRSYDEMTRSWIKEHIELLWMRKDTKPGVHQIAILAVHPDNRRKQFLIKIEDLERKIGYLRKLNAEGFNIYASVNVLQPEAEGRKAEDFLPYQVAVYLDFDSKQKPAHELWKELWQEIQDGKLPPPSWIVKSSTGNYQVYWIFAEPVEQWKLEAIMRGLNERFGLDHAHDVARVFRLPGFRNKKPGKDDLVQPPKNDVIWIDKEKGHKVSATRLKYTEEIFTAMFLFWGEEQVPKVLEKASKKAQEARGGLKEVKLESQVDPDLEELYRGFYERRNQYGTLSEVDMAFTVKALVEGYSPERIASFLVLQRSDKRDPVYYAELTVSEAIAYLREKGLKRAFVQDRDPRIKQKHLFKIKGPGE